jgi:hypothetical protein
MFRANLIELKTRQNELIRQAENYRLVKSFEKTHSPVSRFVSNVGSLFIQLLSHS